ncbi:MAG: glutaredoxin 3 [Proteobacteria bacterium]|nr:glutaredoxin 3 [Pseudomonadota bacterium]
MAYTKIYFKSWCPWSRRALALLNSKGVQFDAVDLTSDADQLEAEMRERSGRTSVPQIFIDDHHIGGYDGLAALEATGRLDKLLAGDDQLNAA